MKKEEFDRLFDLALEDAAKKMPSPDPDLSWARIEDQFRLTKTRSPNRWVSYSAMAASFLLGALIFSSPAVSNAFNPLVAAVKDLQSDVVSFVFGHSNVNEKNAKTAAPPEMDGGYAESGVLVQKRISSWEEARLHLTFPAPDIRYIPDSYKFDKVVLLSDGNPKATGAILIYTSGNDDIRITIDSVKSNKLIATGSDKAGSDIEEIEISGYKAFLYTDSSGRKSLEFMRGDIVISIMGSISTEELVKIAEGIS